MIGKYLVKLKTKFALKRNDAIRISEGYENAKNIGVLYCNCDSLKSSRIDDFVSKLKSDGKTVTSITFVPNVKKTDTFDFPFFTENDFTAKGKWKKPEVEDFKAQPYDYLVSLDWETNKYTRNILAASKAKCRVGRFEEAFSQYFELMINHGDDNYEDYLHQLYHYLKNMRNG